MKPLFKRFLVFLVLLSMAAVPLSCLGGAESPDAAEKDYSSLFEKDNIININVEISEEDWQSMLESPLDEEYKSANITVNGITIENDGIRTKGNMTLRSVAQSDSDRYSFRVKFNKYVKGQKLNGLDELVLNNNYTDPSYMREYLTYEALREIEGYAPETVYTNLYINGELFGFYLCIEGIDDSFLESAFGDDSGNLYKPSERSSLVYSENSEYNDIELSSGDDTEKTGLKNMIKILNDMPDGEKGDIESVLDVDSALKYIALNTVMGSYDSYNGQMGHNYYLYELEGKFYVIPWDYNMSIGGFGGGITVLVDEPVSGVSLDQRPLIRQLLEVPEYKEKYYSYINSLLDYLDGFENRVSTLAGIIRPYIENDPTKFYTTEQFEQSIKSGELTEEQLAQAGNQGMGGGRMGGQSRPGQDQNTNAVPQDQNMPQDGAMPSQDGNMPPDMSGNRQGGGAPPQGGFGERGQAPGQNGADNAANTNGGRTRPEGADQNMQNGGGRGMGGGMMASTSITTYIKYRTENIKKQLSGELPKTSNASSANTGAGIRPENFEQNQEQKITVIVNNVPVTFDGQQPVIKDGRVLVPLRKIFETLGADVYWDADTKTVTATKDSTVIELAIGSPTAYINGSEVTLDVPGEMIGGSTLVPIRFIAESFGLSANWDAGSKTVTIG